MATHKELITAGKFDEKFKRALLNYYSYGFKCRSSFDPKKQLTISEDWLRLNRIIMDYMEWSECQNDVMFASVDSQTMEENPFHRVYRFCKYNPFTYPAYFLHTMAALSADFQLRGGLYALGIDTDQYIRLEDILTNRKDFKTSDLICFYPGTLFSSAAGNITKTPNNRLHDLARLGLVECRQNKGEKGGKGDHRWRLPPVTMNSILSAGKCVNDSFEQHLHTALDFFSKYYLLGEVGTFLCDRIHSDSISPFRFKHEYFIQALNDFNILDFLYAIEHKQWCRVKYSHGVRMSEREILCYPIQIRISNTNGREYLMYYEPFKRSYTSLRIEFVDSVEFYTDNKVRCVLAQAGYHVHPETIDKDISNARKSLRYSWGVSTTDQKIGNATKIAKPHSVTFKIAYNPETDYFIVNRLFRERRIGHVPQPDGSGYLYFSASVSDVTELRPWMRSFYSRLVLCSGMKSDHFSLEDDVKKIAAVHIRDKLAAEPKQYDKAPPQKWGIPEEVKDKLGAGVKAREHELLFNEVFCVYYHIIADVFVQLSSSPNGTSYTRAEILRTIKNSFDKFYLLIGQETENLLPEEILNLLIDGGFLEFTERAVPNTYELIKNDAGTGFIKKQKVEDTYISKYVCHPEIEMYRDIVPLTVLELRWLKTVITDPKMNLFFTQDELGVLNRILDENAPSISILPMNRIKYIDRFRVPKKNRERETAVLPAILKGIYDHKTIWIRYHTNRGRYLSNEFRPIVLEFSKRNNRFQGVFQSCKNDMIFIFNVSQINCAIETKNSFDYAAAEKSAADYMSINTKFVEIEFYNTKNIVDRILMEFSPWKKRCTYNTKTEMYRLKLFYHTWDEEELVVRLLGYGADIRFTDKKHPIAQKIQLRIKKQMDLIKESQKDKTIPEPGNSR